MRAEVRRVLDVIEDVLMRCDEDARDLASILSALRGPDVPESAEAKWQTTAIIRAHAFPRLAAALHNEHRTNAVIWMFNTTGTLTDVEKTLEIDHDVAECVGWHCVSHLESAVKALRRTDE